MRKLLKILILLCAGTLTLFLFSCKNNVNINTYNETTSAVSDGKNTIEETTKESQNYESETTETKKRLGDMNVLNISGYRDTDKSTYIEVEFSKEIADKFDGNSYIKIEPEISFNVSKVNNKFMIRGSFDPLQKYKVTVLSGVKAIDGSITNNDISETIIFTQKKPKIMFSNDGIILPSVNEKKIYIRSLNVNKVKIIVRKIYANNITQFLQRFDFSGNGKFHGTFEEDNNDDYYYYDYESSNYGAFENVGDVLYNVDFDIENQIDTWVQTAIDLSGVLDADGMYMVDVRFDKNGTSYKFSSDEGNWEINRYLRDNGRISKTILLTSVGIMAEKNDDGYLVNVLNIVTNSPVRAANVYLMSKNNQILEEKQTDNEGTVNFGVHKNSFYILVDDKNGKSILMLNNALSTSGFAVDGAYATNGIRGYIYTERGVYRPGDTVYVSIIARNNDTALYDNQPIKITVYDPTGAKYIENDIVKDGKKGFYTYNFKTDVSSKTGIWKLNATIGSEVFVKDISIETVVPNRIKVDLNIPEVVNYNEEISDWTIGANYLFGEPASNLKYGVTFDIREEPIDFPKYKEYAFKAPSSYGYSDSVYLNGELKNDGTDKISPNFEDIQFGSINLLADVSGRVTDDGGRNVVTKKYIKLKKFDTYIGIQNSETYRKPGSKLDLKAICVTEDGETLVSGKTLKYRIYGNDNYWWWDYSDYDQYIRSFKSDKNTKLLSEGVVVTKDVPTIIDCEIPKAEYLYVELEDESTGQITGTNMESSEWVDPSVTKKVETLNLSTDKKKYFVGDVAQIKYKGTESSRAIITIEKSGKIINQFAKNVENGDIVEQIDITKEMAPNVYVYVTLIQNYTTKENDRPLRLYGIVPLNVEDEDTKIDMQIEAPEQIRPNEKFTVKIKNTKNMPVDFTIAVVDEGLLDITAFKTPNPWQYFFQKLASKLSLYDNFSEIIDRPYGAINQILKVGGDEALLDEMARRKRLKDLGLEEADRFTPVSIYKGVLSTDMNGEATVDFDMPNYMGAVRIMVVAANEMSFGSAEKEMVVKAPLIIEPTIPRTLKIGDKMSIPISVFPLEDGIGSAEVYYTFKNKTQSKTINVSKGEKQIVYFNEEIGNEVGSEKLTIGVHSNIYNYEENIKIAINSNNPPIELSENKELNGRNEAIFSQDNEYVKGTVDSAITISNTMMLGLDQRLKYLIRYPYGCAEQTTSSIFPQLFIDKLSTTNIFDKSEIINNINAGISRLKLFQLSDGSFSYWPGDKYTSDWATNYIGHFLIYAKKNGFYLPDSMYMNWINYTEKAIKKTNKDKNSKYLINWKSYALYLLALAGKPNVSEMNYMFENYYNTKMDNVSKMYLAASYKLAGEDKIASTLVSSINIDSIKKMFDEIYARDRYYYSYSYGSKLREIAVYLDCYFTIFGEKDDEAFDEIVNALRTKNWYSTQTTSYALIALSNIVEFNKNETISGTIEIDGVKTEYSADGKYQLTISEDAKNIKVLPDTDGMTYVNYYWEGVPVNSETNDYSDGFSITRHFYDNDGKNIDASNMNSGDTFWLEVVVKPTDRNTPELENIALTQILPTGWEIENLRVTNTKAPSWVEKLSKDTNVSYTDIRDDRVMWFFNYDYNHEYKFFVKINAVTKGEFDFPGTTLEAMYDYNYRAYRKGEKVKVN